jgi:hypothetical protein
MTHATGRLGRLLRPHRLNIAAQVTLALWVAGWIVFGVLTIVHASAELLSGIGAIICVLFAGGFGLRILASRMILRELAASRMTDELVASRSRRAPRVL